MTCTALSFNSIAVVSFSGESVNSKVTGDMNASSAQTTIVDADLALATELHAKGKATYYEKRYEDATVLFYQAMEVLTKTTPEYLDLKAAVFHELGQVQKQAKNWNKAISFHEEALALRLEVSNQINIAVTLKNLAQIEAKRKNLTASLEYAFQGLEIHKTIDEPEDHAEIMVLIGANYRQLGRYDTSLVYLDRAVNLYKVLNNTDQIANSQNQMGLLYKRLGKLEEARAIYDATVNLPQDSIRPVVRATASRELAKLELLEKNYDEALALAKQAHRLFLELNSEDKAIITARTIAQVYSEKNEPEEANKSFDEALMLAEKTNRIKDKVNIFEKLGHHVKKTDTNQALDIYEKALNISESANYKGEQERLLRVIMEIFEERNAHEDAFRTAKKLIRVQAAINDADEKNNIASAKANLEIHLIENELDSLREKAELDSLALAQKNSELEIIQQANKISELELSKNRYASFFLATMVLFCLSFAFYIYRVFIASRKDNQKLNYLANYDELTSCLNRRGFFKELDKLVEQQDENEHLVIIMADIDYFKAVNDNYGHESGDMILVEVGELLRSKVRKGDVVARMGGEEFCIALSGMPLKQAEKLADEIRQDIASINVKSIKITCSFGVAHSHLHSGKDTFTKLISKADKALYVSKENGRDQVTVSD